MPYGPSEADITNTEHWFALLQMLQLREACQEAWEVFVSVCRLQGLISGWLESDSSFRIGQQLLVHAKLVHAA